MSEPDYPPILFQTQPDGQIRVLNESLPERTVFAAAVWDEFLTGGNDHAKAEVIPTPSRLSSDGEWRELPPRLLVTIKAANATFTYEYAADTPDGDKLCTLQMASMITGVGD